MLPHRYHSLLLFLIIPVSLFPSLCCQQSFSGLYPLRVSSCSPTCTHITSPPGNTIKPWNLNMNCMKLLDGKLVTCSSFILKCLDFVFMPLSSRPVCLSSGRGIRSVSRHILHVRHCLLCFPAVVAAECLDYTKRFHLRPESSEEEKTVRTRKRKQARRKNEK